MSWSKHFSKTHQREYWYNKKTGTSTWIDPNTESVKTNKSNNNSEDNIFNNFKEKGYSTDTESVPKDSMFKESNNNQSEKKSAKDLLKLRTLKLRKRKELKEKELLDKKSKEKELQAKERDLLEKELDKQLKDKEFLVNELQQKLKDNIQEKELIVKKLNELKKSSQSNSIDNVNNKTHNLSSDEKKNEDVNDIDDVNNLVKINPNADKDKIEDKDKDKLSIEKKSIPKTSSNISDHKSSSYSMPVESSNGMAWTIEGKSHWTNEDYREALCDLNEAMRDMYR